MTDTRAIVAAGHDPAKAEEAIAAVAVRVSNWGRWGTDDVLGTLNLLTPAKRVEGAACVRRGVAFSLSQSFDMDGPQSGWRRRTNPVHTMLDTGREALDGHFPHGLGRRGRRHRHAAAVLHPVGRARAHLRPRPGVERPRGRRRRHQRRGRGDRHRDRRRPPRRAWACSSTPAARSETAQGELPDSHPITAAELDAIAAEQGVEVREGDIVCVRTGQYARTRREGWGGYAGGPAPGLSFTALDWLHDTGIAAIATDTWGVEVRPNEFENAFQPLHQVAIPHLGLFLGEMWDLDGLADDCAADGTYEFFLTAAPLRITGAVGSPVNPIAVK